MWPDCAVPNTTHLKQVIICSFLWQLIYNLNVMKILFHEWKKGYRQCIVSCLCALTVNTFSTQSMILNKILNIAIRTSVIILSDRYVQYPRRKKEIDQILMTLIAKGKASETAAATSATAATEATTSATATKETEEDTKDPAQASSAVAEKGDTHRSDSSSDEASQPVRYCLILVMLYTYRLFPPPKKKKKKMIVRLSASISFEIVNSSEYALE